jgi:hypothetical protein
MRENVTHSQIRINENARITEHHAVGIDDQSSHTPPNVRIDRRPASKFFARREFVSLSLVGRAVGDDFHGRAPIRSIKRLYSPIASFQRYTGPPHNSHFALSAEDSQHRGHVLYVFVSRAGLAALRFLWQSGQIPRIEPSPHWCHR